MTTEAVSEDGQLVSAPTGTSENWYANCAVPDGDTETVAGGALAGGEMVTVRPLTRVTVSGAPLPEKRASFG